MRKETLQAVGLKAACDVPVQDILNKDWAALALCGLRRTAANIRRIEAVIELLRTPDDRTVNGKIIRTPEDIALLFRDRLRFLDRERLWMVTLAANNRIINERLISEGTDHSVLIDAKAIAKTALMDGASGVILLHNHPSGNARPSYADVSSTKGCKEALNLFDIALNDHIILTADRFFTFEMEDTRPYP